MLGSPSGSSSRWVGGDHKGYQKQNAAARGSSLSGWLDCG